MATIKALYEDAIKYEESLLAHSIFCLIQEGKIELEQDDAVLLQINPDPEKLEKLLEMNYLGFHQMNIFSLKTGRQKWVFIFAQTAEDAQQHLHMKTGQNPLNCLELSPDEVVFTGNRFLNFRELKKEQTQFPCLVGVYEKYPGNKAFV
ncbi:hypothetical protein [Bacillus sp. SD088]|uniref:hypothetical protein n=1 Tax=Bacillus sp. SD088 TaxID=2782012 RepID=UPI001A97A667|nr:hypothetical protein [Bacillus sp. SD088]MBO0994644.1 hypothetical protein [Bacillus sp. SD088]